MRHRQLVFLLILTLPYPTSALARNYRVSKRTQSVKNATTVTDHLARDVQRLPVPSMVKRMALRVAARSRSQAQRTRRTPGAKVLQSDVAFRSTEVWTKKEVSEASANTKPHYAYGVYRIRSRALPYADGSERGGQVLVRYSEPGDSRFYAHTANVETSEWRPTRDGRAKIHVYREVWTLPDGSALMRTSKSVDGVRPDGLAYGTVQAEYRRSARTTYHRPDGSSVNIDNKTFYKLLKGERVTSFPKVSETMTRNPRLMPEPAVPRAPRGQPRPRSQPKKQTTARTSMGVTIDYANDRQVEAHNRLVLMKYGIGVR
jgi:hypothetical protein